MTLFTIKYAPQHSSQIVGQEEGIVELKDFVLNYKKKKYKAALLYGPPGNGKTSSVYALAKELNYDLLEINSSEARNEEALKSFLGSALGQQSLLFRPKIILIDEIDNTFGSQDRGGIATLVSFLEKSTFPLILTANEIDDIKLKTIVKNCQLISFPKVSLPSIVQALQFICAQEKIPVEEKALPSLARQADGDLRAALVDLQICSTNKKITFESIMTLSNRNRMEYITKALTLIFKSSAIENALPALENVDMEPEEVMHWIDENMPKEYLNPRVLAKGYEFLARADVFHGRIRKRQHWRFLAYINDLLTAGISSAKEEKNSYFIEYRRTLRFLQLWQAKNRLAHKKEIAAKLAKKIHTSQRVALQQMPYLQIIFKKEPEKLISELKLEEEEVEWLKG